MRTERSPMNVTDAATEQGNRYGYVTKRGTLPKTSGHFCTGDSTVDDVNMGPMPITVYGITDMFRPKSRRRHLQNPNRNYCDSRRISAM